MLLLLFCPASTSEKSYCVPNLKSHLGSVSALDNFGVKLNTDGESVFLLEGIFDEPNDEGSFAGTLVSNQQYFKVQLDVQAEGNGLVFFHFCSK